jgi:hypothetical protein
MEHPRRELTKEHIIPDALGGTLRYEQAVCRQCAQRGNEKFEQPALATDFLVPRLLLEIKKKSTRSLPSVAKGNWTEKKVPNSLLHTVDVGLYPKRIAFRMFDPPGFLAGVDRSPDLEGAQIRIIDLSPYFPGSMTDQSDLTTSQPMSNGPIEWSIAKAAYFFAVAVKGINYFDGDAIRELLRAERFDGRNFVGSPVQKEPRRADELHQMSLRIRPGGFLTVIVHLFASYAVPPYEVVVGKLL